MAAYWAISLGRVILIAAVGVSSATAFSSKIQNPMVAIARRYRRLNLWSANCGASFEWVGRAINPYLGFLTGWLMIAGYLIGAVAEVVVRARASRHGPCPRHVTTPRA